MGSGFAFTRQTRAVSRRYNLPLYGPVRPIDVPGRSAAGLVASMRGLGRPGFAADQDRLKELTVDSRGVRAPLPRPAHPTKAGGGGAGTKDPLLVLGAAARRQRVGPGPRPIVDAGMRRGRTSATERAKGERRP